MRELRQRKRELLEARLSVDETAQAKRDRWDVFEAAVHGLAMLTIDGMITGGIDRARLLTRRIAIASLADQTGVEP